MTLIEEIVDARPGSALAEAMAQRAEILRLSQATHDAVLFPRSPGAISHGLRAALAARMARQCEVPPLAEHYEKLIQRSRDNDELYHGGTDTQTAAIVAHSDLLTLRPRDATRADIERLKAFGMDEPDIVRLAELAAFVSYQARVIKGLQALKGAR